MLDKEDIECPLLSTGSLLCQGWPLKGLSCVMGNYHAQFLGGLGAAMPPGYPVFCDIYIFSKKHKVKNS